MARPKKSASEPALGPQSQSDGRQFVLGAFTAKVTWLSADDDALEAQASIVDRGEEMVIDVPAGGDTGPYLVIGRLHGNFYAGVDTFDGEPVDVVARWARLGDVCAGIWREDGVEYLFKFDIPKAART